MQRLLVLNLSMSLMWPILNNDYTLGALFLGFLFGFVLMSLVQLKYGLYTLRAAIFAVYVFYAILKSNIRLARQVIAGAFSAQTSLRPGIVAVPLDLTNPFDITILATVITLTPGTLSVDLGEDVSGRLRPFSDPEEPTAFEDAANVEQQGPQEAQPVSRPELKTEVAGAKETVLLVHVIDLSDPVAFRAEIKDHFERPLLQLRSLILEMNAADT